MSGPNLREATRKIAAGALAERRVLPPWFSPKMDPDFWMRDMLPDILSDPTVEMK
jgi:hypothetical protein